MAVLLTAVLLIAMRLLIQQHTTLGRELHHHHGASTMSHHRPHAHPTPTGVSNAYQLAMRHRVSLSLHRVHQILGMLGASDQDGTCKGNTNARQLWNQLDDIIQRAESEASKVLQACGGTAMTPEELLHDLSDKVEMVGAITNALYIDPDEKTAFLPLRRLLSHGPGLTDPEARKHFQHLQEVNGINGGSNVLELWKFATDVHNGIQHLYDERQFLQQKGGPNRVEAELKEDFGMLRKVASKLQVSIEEMEQILGIHPSAMPTPSPEPVAPMPPMLEAPPPPPQEPTPSLMPQQASPMKTMDLRRFDAYPVESRWPAVAEITFIQRMLAFFISSVSFVRCCGGVAINPSWVRNYEADRCELSNQQTEAKSSANSMLMAMEKAGLKPRQQAQELGNYLHMRASQIEAAYAPDMPDEWERKKRIFTLMKATHMEMMASKMKYLMG